MLIIVQLIIPMSWTFDHNIICTTSHDSRRLITWQIDYINLILVDIDNLACGALHHKVRPTCIHTWQHGIYILPNLT